MAILTVDTCVCALEREAGFLLVIEFCRFPPGGGVAAAALYAALAPVDVVGRVAGDAFPWSALVFIAEVATLTRNVRVCVVQWKCGFVVIEACRAPARHFVARSAIPSELAVVWLVLLVTVDARGGRLAIGLAN